MGEDFGVWRVTTTAAKLDHSRAVGTAPDSASREARYQVAMRSAQQSLWEWNPLSDQISVEEPFLRRVAPLDHPAQMPRGDFLNLIIEDDRERVNAGLEAMAQTGEGDGRPFELDFRVDTMDGERCAFTLSVGIFHSDDGAERLYTGLLRDATRLRLLQERLLEVADEARQANAAKSRFLATMSHEIRTPLNGIIGMSELLMSTEMDEQQHSYMETVRTAGQLLLHLVNDILDFSKIEAGHLELAHSPFNLLDAVHDAVQVCRPRANTKELYLIEDIATLPHEIYLGDADRVRQVMVNLVGNAVKFTERGGVEVKVEKLEPSQSDPNVDEIQITVSDTGVGIRKSDLENLFDEFHQADMSISRRYGGSGLGLAITKRLSDAMGGTVDVESEINQGSLFRVRLPLKRANAQDLEGAPARALEKRQAGAAPADEIEASRRNDDPNRIPRILVAEDNQVNQTLIAALLLRAGYDLKLVGNGRDAVSAAQSEQFDLILMDLHMPEMDGLEATKRIRKSRSAASDIPIIALSAEMISDDQALLNFAGIDQHLTKPINNEAFYRAIRYWLQQC
jgi:signal transduction histidine kinase/ActR/RegA family two-component response regulator